MSNPRSNTPSASGTVLGSAVPASGNALSLRPEDSIRILVATDNHIGYMERDPVRGRDGIRTFKEILQIGKDNDVDFILLAGDLFHENRPSPSSLWQVMSLLREYTFNSRPVSIELLSDAGVGIQSGFNFPPINYEDQNLNVGLPVFSIHGNHDDPQGSGPEGALCALDLISTAGLINYFGRLELPGNATNHEEARRTGIHLKPILLQKGQTKLAMYGIGNIRDERFHYEMKNGRISMFRPSQNPEDYFNLMLIHQNRVPRGPGNFVPETGFGDEVDLIIWGHEHDNRLKPEPVAGKEYYISQPGSSIATSLAEGESGVKQVGILTIQDKDFSMQAITLRTVRPFVIDNIILCYEEEENGLKFKTKADVNKLLKKKVEDLIARAKNEWSETHGHEEEMMLPLIRLKVEFSKKDGGNYEIGNPHRFGQDFADRVANPRDIVQFYKRRQIGVKIDKVSIDQPGQDDNEEEPVQRERVQVATLVRQYLQAQNLGILPEKKMEEAVEDFVEKDIKDALRKCLELSLKGQRKGILQNMDNKGKEKGKSTRDEDESELEEEEDEVESEDEIVTEMSKVKDKMNQKAEEDQEKRLQKRKGKSKANDSMDDDEQSDFDKMSIDSESSPPATKGRGKVKSATNTKKAETGRGKKPLFKESEQEEEAEEGEPKPKKKAPTKKLPAKKPPAKKTTTKDYQVSTRTRSTRAATTAAVKKIIVTDSEDEDVIISMDESEDQPRRKTRK